MRFEKLKLLWMGCVWMAAVARDMENFKEHCTSPLLAPRIENRVLD